MSSKSSTKPKSVKSLKNQIKKQKRQLSRAKVNLKAMELHDVMSSRRSTKAPRVKRSRNIASEILKVRRREPFVTLNPEQDVTLSGHVAFDIAHYPAWLKQLCFMYEQIRFERVVFHIIPHYGTMAAGSYYISYNSSILDSPEVLTPERMRQQRNAVTSTIYSNTKMIIPTETFNKPFKKPLCLPTADAAKVKDTWYFDLQYYFQTNTSGTVDIEVEYVATLFTPTIRV